jgi:hypothetical protein
MTHVPVGRHLLRRHCASQRASLKFEWDGQRLSEKQQFKRLWSSCNVYSQSSRTFLVLVPPTSAVPKSVNRDIDPFCLPFNIAVTRILSYPLLVVSFRYGQRSVDVSSLSQTILQVMEGNQKTLVGSQHWTPETTSRIPNIQVVSKTAKKDPYAFFLQPRKHSCKFLFSAHFLSLTALARSSFLSYSLY